MGGAGQGSACVSRWNASGGNPGRREFIQVLRLMEDFQQHQVEQAATQALSLGANSFDAVKMLLLAHLENRPARLDLSFYPSAHQKNRTSKLEGLPFRVRLSSPSLRQIRAARFLLTAQPA